MNKSDLRQIIQVINMCLGNHRSFWNFDPFFYLEEYLRVKERDFHELLLTAIQP